MKEISHITICFSQGDTRVPLSELTPEQLLHNPNFITVPTALGKATKAYCDGYTVTIFDQPGNPDSPHTIYHPPATIKFTIPDETGIPTDYEITIK